MSKAIVTLEPSDLLFLECFNEFIDAKADFKSSVIDFNSRERVRQFDRGNDFKLYLARERFTVRYMEIFYPGCASIDWTGVKQAFSTLAETARRTSHCVDVFTQMSRRLLRE